MGRVKDYYFDEICARALEDDESGPEPDDLEMLAIDAERARERFEEALKEKRHERSR